MKSATPSFRLKSRSVPRWLGGCGRLAFLWLAAPLASVWAQGGPPMLTDDPGTPGDGHWEINTAFVTERARDGTRQSEAPLVDMALGIGERLQLKYEVPWLIAPAAGQPGRAGLGNSNFGVKWRFYDALAGGGVAVSTFPQVEFNNPTSSRRRGLVDGGTTLLLPCEFQGKLGAFGWNAEIGRSFATRGDDEWVYGVAVGRELGPRLELMAEVHGTGRFARADDELVANLGARVALTANTSLLISGGRSINRMHGAALTLITYLGLQLRL